MKPGRKIAIALITAAGIEGLTWLAPFPIDVGYEPGTPWYVQLPSMPWVIVHLPGLRLAEWSGHDGPLLFPILVISGYIFVALLLIGLIFGFQGLRWVARRRFASIPS